MTYLVIKYDMRSPAFAASTTALYKRISAAAQSRQSGGYAVVTLEQRVAIARQPGPGGRLACHPQRRDSTAADSATTTSTRRAIVNHYSVMARTT